MTAKVLFLNSANEDLKGLGGSDRDKALIEILISENPLTGAPLSLETPALRRRQHTLLLGAAVSVIFVFVPVADQKLFEADLAIICAVTGGPLRGWKIPDPDNLAQAVQALVDAAQFLFS